MDAAQQQVSDFEDRACLSRMGWAVVAVLGRGTTATVYRARRHDCASSGGSSSAGGSASGLGEAAVKVMRGKQQEGTEVELLQQLQHLSLRAVAQLVAEPVTSPDGRLLIAVECCRTSLLALVPGRCPLPALRGLAKRLLAGVTELHRVGLVHGDIKPENVLWSAEQADIKLCDLGLTFCTAEGAVGRAGAGAGDDPAVTLRGALNPVSSGGYRAPEAEVWNSMGLDDRRTLVLSGCKPCGPATDVWSCGVVLLELFCGERFWPTSLASAFSDGAPERSTDSSLHVIAAEPVCFESADGLALRRWRQQIARAEEMLAQGVGSAGGNVHRALSPLVMEARALHFGVGADLDHAAPVGGIEQERAGWCFNAAAVREEAQQLGALVMSMMRLHTRPVPSQPPPAAGAPDDQAAKRQRVAGSDTDSTADDWPWTAPAETGGGDVQPPVRLDCAALCSSSPYANCNANANFFSIFLLKMQK